jgi:phosphomannomutase
MGLLLFGVLVLFSIDANITTVRNTVQRKQMKRNLFKAYDIRSKRDNFDDETTLALCHAIAYYMIHDVKTYSIVVGRDTRVGTEAIMQKAIEVFQASGMTVYVQLNAIGSCQFYYNCMQRPKSGGLMITASHNPGSYLGMKLVAPDVQSIAKNCGPKGGLQTVQKYYDEELLCNTRQGGKIVPLNTLDSFIDYSMRLAQVKAKSLKGLPVVCDFLHGSNGEAISRGLNQCGVEGTYLHLVPDGTFPCGDPNPGSEGSTADVRKYLEDHNTDMCFVYDGDGDRMDLLYRGRQLSPCFVMGLVLDELTEMFHGYFEKSEAAFNPMFLFDIKASPALLLNQIHQGKNVSLVQNGHSYIKNTLMNNKENHFLAAVEESAHYYLQIPQTVGDWMSPLFASENTLFFTLLVLKAYQKDPRRFDEARILQDSTWRQREWSAMIKEEGKRNTLQKAIEDRVMAMGAIKVTTNKLGERFNATLLRYNLPKTYDEGATLRTPWFQVFQRVSQSEDALIRWEVLASDEAMGQKVLEEMAKAMKMIE